MAGQQIWKPPEPAGGRSPLGSCLLSPCQGPGPGLRLQAELFPSGRQQAGLALGVKHAAEGACVPEAAMTSHHQPHGLEQQASLLSQSGAQTSKISRWAGIRLSRAMLTVGALGEDLHPWGAHITPASPLPQCQISLHLPLIRTLVMMAFRPTWMIPDNLPIARPPNLITSAKTIFLPQVAFMVQVLGS